jgi:hypothetical protein
MVAEVKINPRIYGGLLAKTLPGIIETEDENERGRISEAPGILLASASHQDGFRNQRNPVSI